MEIKVIERDGVPEAIDEAVSTFFSGNRRSVEEHFVGHEEGDSSTIFGYESGELVGILTIRWKSRNPNLRNQNVPLIQNIEIKSGRRGQGLGNELMAHAEDFIRRRSFKVAICVSLSEAYGRPNDYT
jgi:predicted GNAT family acetyltransferase